MVTLAVLAVSLLTGALPIFQTFLRSAETLWMKHPKKLVYSLQWWKLKLMSLETLDQCQLMFWYLLRSLPRQLLLIPNCCLAASWLLKRWWLIWPSFCSSPDLGTVKVQRVKCPSIVVSWQNSDGRIYIKMSWPYTSTILCVYVCPR